MGGLNHRNTGAGKMSSEAPGLERRHSNLVTQDKPVTIRSTLTKRRRHPRVGWNINEHVCSADLPRSPTNYCKLTWSRFVIGSFTTLMAVFIFTLCCAELGYRADTHRRLQATRALASWNLRRLA